MTPGLACLNLPVYTASGKHLGRVVGVEVDATAKHVTCYQVSSALPLVHLWGEKLLIAPEQVVSISPESMVVVDTFSQEPVVAPSPRPNLAPEPSA